MIRITELQFVRVIFRFAISTLIAWVADLAGKRSLKGGAMIGFVVGFLVMLTMNAGNYAFMNLHFGTLLAMDTVFGAVFYTVTGAIAGAMLGSGSSE